MPQEYSFSFNMKKVENSYSFKFQTRSERSYGFLFDPYQTFQAQTESSLPAIRENIDTIQMAEFITAKRRNIVSTINRLMAFIKPESEVFMNNSMLLEKPLSIGHFNSSLLLQKPKYLTYLSNSLLAKENARDIVTNKIVEFNPKPRETLLALTPAASKSSFDSKMNNVILINSNVRIGDMSRNVITFRETRPCDLNETIISFGKGTISFGILNNVINTEKIHEARYTEFGDVIISEKLYEAITSNLHASIKIARPSALYDAGLINTLKAVKLRREIDAALFSNLTLDRLMIYHDAVGLSLTHFLRKSREHVSNKTDLSNGFRVYRNDSGIPESETMTRMNVDKRADLYGDSHANRIDNYGALSTKWTHGFRTNVHHESTVSYDNFVKSFRKTKGYKLMDKIFEGKNTREPLIFYMVAISNISKDSNPAIINTREANAVKGYLESIIYDSYTIEKQVRVSLIEQLKRSDKRRKILVLHETVFSHNEILKACLNKALIIDRPIIRDVILRDIIQTLQDKRDVLKQETIDILPNIRQTVFSKTIDTIPIIRPGRETKTLDIIPAPRLVEESKTLDVNKADSIIEPSETLLGWNYDGDNRPVSFNSTIDGTWNIGFDDLWKLLIDDDRLDYMIMPQSDYDYAKLKDQVYDVNGVPYNPLSPPNVADVYVNHMLNHPVDMPGDFAKQELWVNNYYLRDITIVGAVYLYRYINKFAGMSAGEGVNSVLNYMHDYIYNSEGIKNNPGYHRALRFARWYGERCIMKYGKWLLVRDYGSWMDNFAVGDFNCDYALNTWDNVTFDNSILTLGGDNFLTLSLTNYIDGTFSFSTMLTDGTLTVSINNQLIETITPDTSKRYEFNVPMGTHAIVFHYVGSSCKLSGLVLTGARFIGAYTKQQDNSNDLKGIVAARELITYLIRYHMDHWHQKSKGDNRIKQRKMWIR